MTKHNCCHYSGNGARCKKKAVASLFTILPVPESSSHLASRQPRYCRDCVRVIVEKDSCQKYIGYLFGRTIDEYQQFASPGGPAEHLLTNGYVVTSFENDTVRSTAHQVVRDHLKNVQKLDCLRDSFSPGSESTIDGRTWLQLYPKGLGMDRTSSPKHFNALRQLSVIIQQYVQKNALPHLHYAQVAYNFAHKDPHPAVAIQDKVANTTVSNQKLLDIFNVNLFSKSQVLTPQHLHCDGLHMRLVLIMPLLNGDDGYNINLIPKSHNPMSSHNRNMAVPKSLVEVKNIHFQKNEFIIFAESLIHSGGISSSKSSENYNHLMRNPLLDFEFNKWHGGNLKSAKPSDIALQFQFTVEYGIQNSDVGNASNFWFRTLLDGDQDASNSPEYAKWIESFKDNYRKEINQVQTDWINSFVTGRIKPRSGTGRKRKQPNNN